MGGSRMSGFAKEVARFDNFPLIFPEFNHENEIIWTPMGSIETRIPEMNPESWSAYAFPAVIKAYSGSYEQNLFVYKMDPR